MAPVATEGDWSRSSQAWLLQSWLGSQQPALASLCLQVLLESVPTVHRNSKLKVGGINTLESRVNQLMGFGTETPQLLWPRNGGNSAVFVLHRSWVFPVDGVPVTPSGDSLDITAFALLTTPPFLPLLHSLSSVSFTFQIIYFPILVCFWETLPKFNSVSDNVLSISHTLSHLLSFNEQNSLAPSNWDERSKALRNWVYLRSHSIMDWIVNLPTPPPLHILKLWPTMWLYLETGSIMEITEVKWSRKGGTLIQQD